MEISFANMWTAIDKLRDEVGHDNIKNATIEVSMVGDDPGNGKMIECLTLKASKTVSPSQYDNYKTLATYEYTMEVFADSEKRPPRLTVVQTRDLERRDR